ncbi:MAG: type II secretion system protein [Pseudomonadota bacterium]
MSKRRCHEAGFTLFEVMVALMIVGLMLGIVVVGIGSSIDKRMKNTSNHFASMIRYLYNKSAVEGLYIRLVIDLDERSYWVEASADPVVVAKEEGNKKKTKADEQKAKDEEQKKKKRQSPNAGAKDVAGPPEGKADEPGKLKVPKPQFSPLDAYLLRPSKLPDVIFFKDVQVEHKSAPVEGGTESIYFFPNGYVEKAVINFRDEKDEVNYSIETNPINGHVSIDNRYRSMRDEK